MLADGRYVTDISDDGRWRFEGKWDGIRALATVGPNGLRLHSRTGNDFTHAYPELQELADLLDGHSGVLDGEIVALDADGRTSFSLLQQRMNLAAARDVARVRKTVPVQFWLFDVLHLDGVSLLRKRYDDRRRSCRRCRISGDICVVPDQLPGTVQEALQGSVDRGWEGIVAKRADSTYLPGKRSHSWIKIKNFRDLEVVIVGWKPGSGRREGSLGSLLLAVPDESGGLRYAGKVGTGFTDVDPRSADGGTEAVAHQQRLRSPTSVPRAEAVDAVWVRAVAGGRGQVRRVDPRPPAAGDQLAGAASGQVGRRSGSTDLRSALLLELAPPTRPVVRDDLPEHLTQRRGVDLLTLANSDRSGRAVLLPAGDDALRVGNDRAVVEEHVDVVLGRQQRGDVAVQHEVRLNGPLDRLDHLGIGGMHEIPDLLADLLLPVGQLVDVGVDPGSLS